MNNKIENGLEQKKNKLQIEKPAAPGKGQAYSRPAQSAVHLQIGVSTLWKWVKEKPDFPQPIKLSPRVTVFRIADLDAFIARQQIQNGGCNV